MTRSGWGFKSIPNAPQAPGGKEDSKEPREVEAIDCLEFIARVSSHIPDKGQVTVRYYGLYANAHRGKVKKASLLADRNVPWWMLGLAGCSSYIDIGGTMSMVRALFYLGLKSL